MRKLLLSLSLLVMTVISAMAEVAEPTKSLSALDVVKEYTWTIDYVFGKGYEGFEKSTQLDGLYDALGVTAEELDANIGSVLMVRESAGPAADGEPWTITEDGLVAYGGESFRWGTDGWLGSYDGVGAPQGWGGGSNTVFLQNITLENGLFTVGSTGQFPGLLSVGNDNKIDLYICNGTKAAKVTVVINVYEKTVTLEEPATSFSALEVVKEYKMPLDLMLGKFYEGITLTCELEGVYEALGVTSADLDADVADYTFTRVIGKEVDYYTGENNDEPVYKFVMSDDLKTPDQASDGSWFGRYQNYIEETDTYETIKPNAPMGWGAGCTIYAQNIKLNEGVFSIFTGQFPDTFKSAGVQDDVVELYIVNGTKAVKISVVITINEPEILPIEEMTKAGEAEVDVAAEVNTAYETTSFTVDMAAILEAIGSEEIDEFKAWATEGTLAADYTASGGYWYDHNGYVTAWGAGAAFFIEPASLANGKFNIGQFTTGYADITEPVTESGEMIFLGKDKYYVVKVNYTVNPEGMGGGEEPVYNKVATEGIVMQIVPSPNTYEWGPNTVLDMDYIESKIGTKDFELYSDKWNASKEQLTWAKGNTGFTIGAGVWYGANEFENEEHQVVVTNEGWGSNSFGLSYYNGELIWWQFPGQRSVGDKYLAHLYLVNEETGDYLDYEISVEYVETLGGSSEVVGTLDMPNHVVTAEEQAEYVVVSVPAAEVFEALGMSEELIDAASLLVRRTPTTNIQTTFEESFGLDLDGYYVALDDPNKTYDLLCEAKCEGGNIVFSFDLVELDFLGGEPMEIPCRFGIEYDGKLYNINFALSSPVKELKYERLPLTGGSGSGSELAIDVLEEGEDGEPLAATYTITNGTWGENASHLSLFKHKLSAEQIADYAGAIIVFESEVPASAGDPTYGFIPVGFICPADGFVAISGTNVHKLAFTDKMKADGVDDFSVFFNASGDLKNTSVVIKGVYLVSDLDADLDAVGINSVAPAVVEVPAGIYTVSGAKVDALQRGLNIVKMADGTVKKVLVK